ncbi:MAG: Rrf2 family transcriptional regulator [Verrucomicrobiota bacterium]
MKLSLFSDYSLRVLIYASLREGRFQLKDVSQAYGISRNHLAQVVHRLGQLGYLETRRGRGGGCRLARPAGEVRIGRLFQQTEDQPAIMECFDQKTNTCRMAGNCRIQGALAQAMAAFYSSLDQYTLADVVTGTHGEVISRILMSIPN